MSTTTDYQQQAIDFLTQHGIKFNAKYLTHDYHFEGDKETRDIYRLTLKRPRKQVSFRFGQSIAHTGITPTAYDLLATLQKYDTGDFENFCGDFGYDTDSRKAEKTYKAVKREWEKVNSFFTRNELNELQGIN